jgi:REP element-mobilizing transposase RayT
MMARPLRLEYEGAVYHVTARGNERGKIFFSKRDYEKFKEYMAAAKEKYGFILHAYVLMTNHYHLIIETPEKNLSRIMQYINSSYTTYTNVKRKRVGHLFQGRYKAILVDRDNYLLELSRYVHLNPVRVNLAQKPEEYPHSSYWSYVTDQTEPVVSSDTILQMVTAKRKDAPDRYRSFVESALGAEMASPMQKVYGGMILGKEGFIRDTLARVESERLETPEVSHGKALRYRMGLEDTLSACCEHFKIAREEILRDKRSEARKACIYLMKKHTGATNREIAELFGTLTYSAVAKISQNFSRQMAVDKELRWRINGFRVGNSLFKA